MSPFNRAAAPADDIANSIDYIPEAASRAQRGQSGNPVLGNVATNAAPRIPAGDWHGQWLRREYATHRGGRRSETGTSSHYIRDVDHQSLQSDPGGRRLQQLQGRRPPRSHGPRGHFVRRTNLPTQRAQLWQQGENQFASRIPCFASSRSRMSDQLSVCTEPESTASLLRQISAIHSGGKFEGRSSGMDDARSSINRSRSSTESCDALARIS
jgi:hypothetical protein